MATARKLEPLTEYGKPRCQRWIGKKGRQCQRAARKGFRVCQMHGAGSEKREREGRRKNPRTASLVTGSKASPETLRTLLEQHPELGPLYNRHLNGADLLDFRPQLAAAKTLLDHYLQRANLDRMDELDVRADPPILRAIAATERIVAIAERVLALEQKLGPVSRAELEQMTYAFAATLTRFVAPEQLEVAREFLRTELLRSGLGRSGVPATRGEDQ